MLKSFSSAYFAPSSPKKSTIEKKSVAKSAKIICWVHSQKSSLFVERKRKGATSTATVSVTVKEKKEEDNNRGFFGGFWGGWF